MATDSKRQAIINDLHASIWNAIDSTPGLAQAMRDLEGVGLRLLGINFQLVIYEPPASEPVSPAQTDAEFLRSLRISTEEPGEQPR